MEPSALAGGGATQDSLFEETSIMKVVLVCQDNRTIRKVGFIPVIYIFRKCLTN
jgi:hypothetical protein